MSHLRQAQVRPHAWRPILLASSPSTHPVQIVIVAQQDCNHCVARCHHNHAAFHCLDVDRGWGRWRELHLNTIFCSSTSFTHIAASIPPSVLWFWRSGTAQKFIPCLWFSLRSVLFVYHSNTHRFLAVFECCYYDLRCPAILGPLLSEHWSCLF